MEIVFVCWLAFVALLAFAVWAKYRQGELVDRFPPISDEEFMRRCSPGTDPAVALKVRRIIATHLAIDYDRIHPSMRFVDDLAAC